MKKLFLSLIALTVTSLTSLAEVTLNDAYLSVADLPGMKLVSELPVQITTTTDIQNVRSVSATSHENIDKLHSDFTEVVASLPEGEVVKSNTVKPEFSTIFAEPDGSGQYNILILQGNDLTGIFTATYGNTDSAGLEAIKNSKVSLNGNDLVITPAPEGATEYIGMAQ